MAQPPIHIVVKNGHVTLAGVVNSNVERALARSLAIGFGAFDVKNALKTDDEMKGDLEDLKKVAGWTWPGLDAGRARRLGRYQAATCRPFRFTHQIEHEQGGRGRPRRPKIVSVQARIELRSIRTSTRSG